MRVLLAAFVADSDATGMGRWAHRVADALVASGHEPTTWFDADFPTVRRAGRWAVLFYPLALALAVWRHRRDFDVAIVHEAGGFWCTACRHVGADLPPIVAMCHNVESKVYRLLLGHAARGSCVVGPRTRLLTPLLRLWQSDGAIRRADHVVCLSREDCQYVVERLGVAAESVTLIRNGVDARDSAPRAMRRSGHRVLCVGGWLDVKGRRVLPPLWSAVREMVPDAGLTLVGTGASEQQVRAAFVGADRASVRVAPRIEHATTMAAQYADHDVLLLPSLSEGCPLVLLEALHAGLPVVAARTGGIPDVVTAGRDAWLFEAGDHAEGAKAVCALLRDPDVATRLADAGRQTAQGLTWAATAQGLLAGAAAAARGSGASA